MATHALTREESVRRGIVLERLTIGWNLAECLVAVGAGLSAASIALVGFGIDSAIESTSGVVLLWRLNAESRGRQVAAVERTALKLVAGSFFLLAAYVAWDSATALITHKEPERSFAGIVLAVVSLIVMPLLAKAKRKTAEKLESAALQADSRQTSLCAYLSAILLAGLALNATLGWWWSDPVAGLLMVPIIANEGRRAMKGETCSDCH
ncbi:MAG TPA: cation transporter [Terriglobales bacterium]|nr:cation transporter [Terriglobales bacterium]